MSGQLRLDGESAMVILLKRRVIYMFQTKNCLFLFIYVLIISGSTLFAQTVGDNQIIVPANTSVIPFCWQGDSIGGAWVSCAAMLIPVKIKDCPRVFYMQFDTGSPFSVLYSNKFEAIKSRYPGAFHQHVINSKLKDFSCTAGRTPIGATEIVVAEFDNSTINWNDTTEKEIIGTFGTDLIDNKVVIIDYRRNQMVISDNISTAMAKKVSLANFIYNNRAILLPALVNEQTTHLFFDTGASMFALLTDKETCYQLAVSGASISSYKVPSWGAHMMANTLLSNDSLKIGGLILPLGAVTYMEGVRQSQIDRMRAMGIGGMTGNILFLDHQFILDTKRQQFGITSE